MSCANCGSTGALRCGSCKAVRYCDRSCQRAHWPTHKRECGAAVATAAAPATVLPTVTRPVVAPPPIPAAVPVDDALKEYMARWTGSAPTGSAAIALMRQLQAAGFVPEPEAGRCALAAILSGHLLFTGSKAELDKPASLRTARPVQAADHAYSEEECTCCAGSGSGMAAGVMFPTLRQLLLQPDYGGNDYEDGLEGATVRCKCGACAAYVTGMCAGRFTSDSGKFHNHCMLCPFPGRCLGDYREQHCEECGQHYFCTAYTEDCPRCHPRGVGDADEAQEEDDEVTRAQDEQIKKMLARMMGRDTF